MPTLRLGDREDFATVHRFLGDSGYLEAAICERLELGSIHELVGNPDRTLRCSGGDDAIGLLVRLFLLSETAKAASLESVFQPAVVSSLRALGLLTEASEPGSFRASVALYPAYGLYFVSDLWINVDGSLGDMPPDLVFPAIGPNTLEFSEILPQDRCEDLLELCSGTGVAALLAASNYACRACAVDITERASNCAEFSARLNALENVTVLRGDLYEPLGGRAFDRIVAHPPYLPSLEPDQIFRDGGPDGQHVTQAIAKGAARHLKPGGRLHCLTMGVERNDCPFERQVREWLPPGSANLDVFFFAHRTHKLREFAQQDALSRRADRKRVRQWLAHFANLGITGLTLGELVIRRNAGEASGVTIRRTRGSRSGRAEVEWLLGWESSAERRELEWMLQCRPIMSYEAELCVRHRLREGGLSPVQFGLQVEYPFSTECRVDPWMAPMLARCDGTSTLAAIFDSCREDGLIHKEAPREEFVQLMRTLISGGFLLVKNFYPPQLACEPAADALIEAGARREVL